MPLHWDEVKKGPSLKDFTIQNSIERIKSEGDQFKGTLQKGIDMAKAQDARPSMGDLCFQSNMQSAFFQKKCNPQIGLLLFLSIKNLACGKVNCFVAFSFSKDTFFINDSATSASIS